MNSISGNFFSCPGIVGILSRIIAYILLWFGGMFILAVVSYTTSSFGEILLKTIYVLWQVFVWLLFWRKSFLRPSQSFTLVIGISILTGLAGLYYYLFPPKSTLVNMLDWWYLFLPTILTWPLLCIFVRDVHGNDNPGSIINRCVLRNRNIVSLAASIALMVFLAWIFEMTRNLLTHIYYEDKYEDNIIRIVWGAAFICMAAWLFLWRHVAFGSVLNLFKTIIAAGVSLLIGESMDYSFSPQRQADPGHLIFYLPSIYFTVSLFVVLTSFLWKRNHQQSKMYYISRVNQLCREKEIYCPACGYNLNGLTNLRCPECGKECTAIELMERNLYLRNPDLWLN